VQSIDPFLNEVKAEIDKFVPDVTTVKGRKEIASIAFKVAQVKSRLESLGKELADQQKEIPKKIDATRRHVRDTLDKWKDEVRRPLTEWEEAEEARIKQHTDWMDWCTSLQQTSPDVGSARVAQLIGILEAEDPSERDEFAAQAKDLGEHTLKILADIKAQAEKREAEAIELEKLRAEAAERARKDEQERIAREAVERERVEAAQRVKADQEAAMRRETELRMASEKAERDRIEAEQRAKDAERRAEQAKEQAERDAEAARIRELEHQQQEQKKREADKKYKAQVNGAALDALVAGGMDKDQAKMAIVLIAKRQVPQVSINY